MAQRTRSAIADRSPRTSKARGPVAWYGGKARLTKWLGPLVPTTGVYAEPYGGAAALLFSRPPAKVEVYNDLDGRLVNLFRALQDPARLRLLERRLRATFYSRAEFELALEVLGQEAPDVDELAWAFFVAQNQCFGGIAKSRGQWARTKSACGSTRPRSWWSRVDDLDAWAFRLVGVQIEQSDGLAVLRSWDGPDTTYYIDPPYVHDTRDQNCRQVYAVEPDDGHHRELVALLLELEAACVLSGYTHGIYAELEEAGWQRVDRDVACPWRGDRAARRIECVWRNPRAVELTERSSA